MDICSGNHDGQQRLSKYRPIWQSKHVRNSRSAERRLFERVFTIGEGPISINFSILSFFFFYFTFMFLFCLQINYCKTLRKEGRKERKEGRVGRAYLVMRSLDIRFHVAGRIEWSVNGKCVIATRVVRHPPFFVLLPSLSFARLAILMGRPNFVKIIPSSREQETSLKWFRLIGVIGMMIGKTCETWRG